MILDETRERFIKAILAKVDPTRIAEIHFFAPIKQGGVESGVAVIAVAPRAPVAQPTQIDETAETAEVPETQPVEEAEESEAVASAADPESAEDAESTDDAETDDAESGKGVESTENEQIAEAGGVRHPEATAQRAAAEGPLDAEEDSPYADSAEDFTSAHSGPSEGSPPQDDAVEQDDTPPAPIERHVIYTARYRLTLKGPDRGKWETNITAEADAPIITVDAVVRGVQRRAGDVDDPTRMTGDEIRASVPAARQEQPAHAR